MVVVKIQRAMTRMTAFVSEFYANWHLIRIRNAGPLARSLCNDQLRLSERKLHSHQNYAREETEFSVTV